MEVTWKSSKQLLPGICSFTFQTSPNLKRELCASLLLCGDDLLQWCSKIYVNFLEQSTLVFIILCHYLLWEAVQPDLLGFSSPWVWVGFHNKIWVGSSTRSATLMTVWSHLFSILCPIKPLVELRASFILHLHFFHTARVTFILAQFSHTVEV